MRQHSVDLLPASIKARGRAGVRRGQLIFVGLACATALVILISHSKLVLNKARLSLYDTQVAANKVIETEAHILQLRSTLEQGHDLTHEYHRTAFPLESSSVVATVVRLMPPGMTLEQFTIDAGQRAPALSPRGKSSKSGKDSGKNESLPRFLTAEVGGFAPSDQEIAQFVALLSANSPFENVSLDFSKTREIRSLAAREFRVSFRIDLDARYEIQALKTHASAQSSETSTDGN